jgi:hypothetical protein
VLGAGEVLRGDRIESTAYLVSMKVNKTCVNLCSHVNSGEPMEWSEEDSDRVINMIRQDYSVHL